MHHITEGASFQNSESLTVPECNMREDRWKDRQRDAQVEEKRKTGGREGGWPQTLLYLKYWSLGSRISPCFPRSRGTLMPGDSLDTYSLFTCPATGLVGRKGGRSLGDSSSAARALPVFRPSTSHGSPRDRKVTIL